MNERVIDRAVVLWKRMLANPQYKATDDRSSREDQRSMDIASMMTHLAPNNATPDVLDKFGEELRRRIAEQLEQHGHVGLHVDYGPDGDLRAAADAAGLKMQFPWKTDMWIDPLCVSVRAGYRAESVCHYPITGDRWLVTTLSGSDIVKVIAVVESDYAHDFTVEADAVMANAT